MNSSRDLMDALMEGPSDKKREGVLNVRKLFHTKTHRIVRFSFTL